MKIAIDLNDVIRDYSDNFLRTYVRYYNHEFDYDEYEQWSYDMQEVLPFKNERAYQNFVYVDYPFEIFGKCDVCTRNLSSDLNTWINGLKDRDDDEPIEIMIVSPMEYGPSINYSYFFISKLGCDIREVYFPTDSRTIWDRCDILITANPKLMESKPEGKKVIKIKTAYNVESQCDYAFSTLNEFLKNNDILSEL